jgi:alpha-mannosidase
LSENKVVHVISHSHWDREWYLPFEKHRLKLVVLIDTLLELFESDPGFRSFHLDGQTIVLDDYLQIRPERRERLVQLVQEDKLHVGPWYILQDEFLTSSEANVRNLLVGLSEANKFGKVSRIGYFPDSFGNIGQAPQLLRQAGMDCAIFGRGVKATGFNNSVDEGSGDFESPYSEMHWESPDGSSVLGVLFANWYHNGMEIPVDAQWARDYWTNRLAKAKRYASTPHLLFMNGCDHQPVQRDLTEALGTAKQLFPEVTFVHSNFNDYLRSLKETLPEHLAVVRGELRSQRTDGWSTLVNTASSRIYIKQANQLGQALLEKVAEPLAVFAATLDVSYPHHLFTYAWKTLMQNHPHDSICGCSVDEVHREMMTRFEKSRQVAEALIDDSLKAITEHIDTSCFASLLEEAVPFVVFNTTGWQRSGTVTVELKVSSRSVDGVNISAVFDDMQQEPIAGEALMDHTGKRIPFEFEDLGIHFSYDLPDHAFRQRFMVRKIRLTFAVADLPALGYVSYAWGKPVGVKSSNAGEVSVLLAGERSMENEWLHVVIARNGSLILTDKRTGRVFRDLAIYEDVGDVGNEYIFVQPGEDEPLTTAGMEAGSPRRTQ